MYKNYKPRPNKCLEYRPTSQSVLFCDDWINLSVLSLSSHISVSHLSMIFSGKRQPSLKSTKIIAESLGMDLQKFVEGLETHLGLRKAPPPAKHLPAIVDGANSPHLS